MKSIFAKEFSRIELGYRGENLARQVIFDLANWQEVYGNGTAILIARLPNTQTPYPCSVLQEGDKLLWRLSASDTSVAGKGNCELSYYVGERLVKSAIFQTYVAESLAPVGDAPDPKESWIEDILAAGADAVSAKEAIENMSVSSETLSSGSVATVTKTKQDGKVHLTFSIPRGEQGEKGENGASGKTPVRGEDYFTEEDVSYFEQHLEETVNSHLGELEGALDGILALQESLIGGVIG